VSSPQCLATSGSGSFTAFWRLVPLITSTTVTSTLTQTSTTVTSTLTTLTMTTVQTRTVGTTPAPPQEEVPDDPDDRDRPVTAAIAATGTIVGVVFLISVTGYGIYRWRKSYKNKHVAPIPEVHRVDARSGIVIEPLDAENDFSAQHELEVPRLNPRFMNWVNDWASNQPPMPQEDAVNTNLALARIPEPPPLVPVVSSPPGTPQRLSEQMIPASAGRSLSSIPSTDAALGGMQIVVDTGFWDWAREWGQLHEASQSGQLRLPNLPQRMQLVDASHVGGMVTPPPMRRTAEQALRLADAGPGRVSPFNQSGMNPQLRLSLMQ